MMVTDDDDNIMLCCGGSMGDVARVVVVACLRRHLEFFGKLLVSCSCACVGEDRPVGLLIWAPNNNDDDDSVE